MKAFLVVLACFIVCGCEDDNRTTTTTNEAADDVVNIPTNGVATVATVNTTGDANTTIVYIQTLPGVTQVYEVNTIGNSNLLGFFSTGPVVVPASTNAEPVAP
jgi:hypothetical protein